MNSTDSIKTLLAAGGGDTVKLFDLASEPRDTCILTYTPSPGSQVNSVKWNHTSRYLYPFAIRFSSLFCLFVVLCGMGLNSGFVGRSRFGGG